MTPTAIDDNCLVLSFNQWYTEPSEHDWSVCAMPLAPLCRSVAHTGAFARSLRGCDFHSCPACVACMTQVSMICTHTRERIRARAHWHARIVTARATLCTSTQRRSPSTHLNALTRRRRRRRLPCRNRGADARSRATTPLHQVGAMRVLATVLTGARPSCSSRATIRPCFEKFVFAARPWSRSGRHVACGGGLGNDVRASR